MNRLKNCLIFCFVLLIVNVYGQYKTDFSNVQLYTFQVKIKLTSDQAIKISQVTGKCLNVLFARTDISGLVSVYTTGPIDPDELEMNISVAGNIKYSKPKQGTAVKSEFLKSYALFLYPENDTYSGEKIEKVICSDAVKEEVVYGLAKSIWVELYPDKYSSLQPTDIEKTDNEKAEKEAKENDIDFKSKQK